MYWLMRPGQLTAGECGVARKSTGLSLLRLSAYGEMAGMDGVAQRVCLSHVTRLERVQFRKEG